MALQECVKCKGISMIMLDEQFQRFCGWKMTYPEYMIGNLEVLDQMARNKKLLPWPIVITSITLAVWFQQVLQQCQRSLPFLHKTTYVSKKMLRIVDGMFVMRIENNTSNSVLCRSYCILSPSLGLLRSADGCIVGDPISLATCNATIGCHELQRM